MARKINENSEDEMAADIMVADTGGGRNSTITKRSLYVLKIPTKNIKLSDTVARMRNSYAQLSMPPQRHGSQEEKKW
eukprot:4729058-Ditylum_brightwellii.AAC.1